jgi:hypothetical protein
MKQRRFGFPLHMLVGFIAGAGIGVAVAFLTAPPDRRILYTALLKFVFALGGLGTYLGHVLGAATNKDAGIEPFGVLPTGALVFGGVIALLGSIAVCGAVLGIMTALYGPSPH